MTAPTIVLCRSAMRCGGEDLRCPGRRILDVLQRAQYLGGDAGLRLAVNAGTVSRRCYRIDPLEFADQRDDLLAADERQVHRRYRRGRIGQPAIWLPRLRMDAEQNALAGAGKDLKAVERLSINDEARSAAIERQPLRRPADAQQRRLAENVLRDVTGALGRSGSVQSRSMPMTSSGPKANPMPQIRVEVAPNWRISASVGGLMLHAFQPEIAGRFWPAIMGMIARHPLSRSLGSEFGKHGRALWSTRPD